MFRRDLVEILLSMLAAAGLPSLLADLERALAPGDAPETASRTAVVDRIEGDHAVLVFDDGSGTETVLTATLPEPAREPGVVLRIPEGDALALATVDRAATARRRREAQDRFDELAEPAPDPDEAANATGS